MMPIFHLIRNNEDTIVTRGFLLSDLVTYKVAQMDFGLKSI